jgi:hypothetical protein
VRQSTFFRRSLETLTLLAVAWAIVIALTGGFQFRIAGVRLSSHNVQNPLLLALATACAAIALPALHRRRMLTDDLRWWWTGMTAARNAMTSAWWGRWINMATVAACGGAGLLLHHWVRGRPLWLDEQMIALNIRDRTMLELAGPLWLDQSAPYGWLATQRTSTLLFGLGDHAVRAVPVAFGLAALAASAWVGRRWMSAQAAVALVLLFSLGEWVFHYSLELKPYSGDVFLGLLLPALVVWAMEGNSPGNRLRRAALWWVAAAVGQWWAYGATFVTPACALVLWAALWRADGWRRAAAFAVFGVGWLAAFGLHYLLVLRFTLVSSALRDYWSATMVPPEASLAETVRWLGVHVAPLADSPGGSTHPVLFWATALCGFLFARRWLFACVFGTVVASAFLLAGIRMVPLYERLSLWALPALYVGIALSLDAATRWGRNSYTRGQPGPVAAAVLMTVAGLWSCVDIGQRGWRDITNGYVADSNLGTDDRTGVRWLLAQRRPGDAVLTTGLGLPAVWWYGHIPLGPPASGTALPDGSPVLQVLEAAPGEPCGLTRALAPYTRALLFMGFPDRPEGFDDRLLRELSRIGEVVALRRLSISTVVAVVTLAPGAAPAGVGHAPSDLRSGAGDCVSARPPVRW